MQLGITPPISTNGPTDNDRLLTEQLEKVLKDHGMFEPESEARKREVVLGKLNMLVKKFVKKVCIKQGLGEKVVSEAGGKIFTFGSYRLGVHSSGADIDTLCVVPQNVERSEFFSIFFDTLKNHPEVTELTGVPDAYVPVIKMSFNGIPIDLLFANLALTSIPDELDLLDNSLLRNIDGKCILSINGSRVADQIVRLVPSLDTFRLALRCIKLWAKKRAIYSNVMGYLGGVAWALMVGRICQLYPNASPSRVVSNFFTIFHHWRWPAPVLLKQTEDGPLTVWNPKTNPMDRNHLMPVITPAYPAMCSTHNVSGSTLKVMTLEFLRGTKLCLDIEHGRGSWEDLFAKSDFFYRYKTYLRVLVGATSEEFHRLWLGMVESKLRVLVMKLEILPGIESAPPFPYGFESSLTGSNLEAASSSNQNQPEGSLLDELSDSKKFYCTSYYIGLEVKMKSNDNSNAPKKLSVEKPVSDFKRVVLQWEKFLPTEMDITIQAIKRGNLPDEVYDGMPRPSSLKRKKTPKTSTSTKTVNEDDDEAPATSQLKPDNDEASLAEHGVDQSSTNIEDAGNSTGEGARVEIDQTYISGGSNTVEELSSLHSTNSMVHENSSKFNKKKPSLKLL